jgi:prolyl oligopeptidase
MRSLLAFSFAVLLAGQVPPQNDPSRAAVHEVVDTYFGVGVSDPYRWMEDTKSPELAAYLDRQNENMHAALAPFASQRWAFLQRIKQLNNSVDRVNSVRIIRDQYFYLELPPGAKDARLMVRKISDKAGRLLVDPKAFASAGTHAAITYFEPSWDGKLVAIGIALGGSEDAVIHVVQVSTGEPLKDAISRTQYASPAWTEDNVGFYYMRQHELPKEAPATAIYENTRVYYHKVGETADSDRAVFGPDVDPSLQLPKAGFVNTGPLPGTSRLIAGQSRGTIETPALWLREPVGDAHWKPIAGHEDGVIDFASKGTILYVLTKAKSPNGRVVKFDAAKEDMAHAREILPESDLILTSSGESGIASAADALYVYGRRNGTSVMLRVPYDDPAKKEEIHLPFSGSLFDVSADYRVPGLLFSMDGWTKPSTIYRFDPTTGRAVNTGLQPHDSADFSNITSIEVEAPSVGGVLVPLSIVFRKDLILDGSHPTLMEAYGAYGISISPSFSAPLLTWLERGGIVAFAHVRGGGEKGEAWHLDGQKGTKQHTIDDFVACANYLIEHRYTSREHLAVKGTSAGGFAVGGFITQHPELIRAALDRVGVSDPLRFETSQGGDANIPEFGSVKIEADFRSLYSVSPYHHVKQGVDYPAVLLETGINDPRVPSWQAAKMAARLQAATSSHLPILLRVDKDAGHGIGSDRNQRAELLADEYIFLAWQLGLPGFQRGMSR